MHEFLDLFQKIPIDGPAQFPLGLGLGRNRLGTDYFAARVAADHFVQINRTTDADGLELLAVEPVAYEGPSALAVQLQVARDAARLLMTLAFGRNLAVYDPENPRPGVVTARLATLLATFVKRDTGGTAAISDVFLGEDATLQAGALRRLKDARIRPIDRASWAELRAMFYSPEGGQVAPGTADFLLAVNDTYRRALVRPCPIGPIYHDDATGTWRHACGLTALDNRAVLVASF
jgi:hypothetical protein